MSSDQESENESWGDSEDDDDDHQSGDERTESDDDKSIDLHRINDDEETQENEFIHALDDYVPMDDETHDVDDEEYVSINKELYGDVNVEMKNVEHANESKCNEEITNATQDNVEMSQEKVDDDPATHIRILMFLHLVPDVMYHLVIPEPTVIKPPKIVTAALVTTIPLFISTSQQSTHPPIPTTSTIITEAPTSTFVNPKFETLSTLQLRISNLEKKVKELKQVDLSTTLNALIRSKVPPVVNEYLGSSLGDAR
uniref:Uncharacterized protein n=1 Tax=Tanacetum cinerariifolium TaxID=118510 RepID=A0A6L2NWD6_TANCI|nr:hypothetical protein [Tanacetum cinerariifolium]